MYEEALEAYEQAAHFLKEELSMLPEAASLIEGTLHDAFEKEGECLYTLGRFEEALTVYEEALRLDTADTRLYFAKSDVYLALDRLTDALDAIKEIVNIEPDNVSVWLTKGDIHRTLTQDEEALRAYEQAIKIDPDNDTAKIAKSELMQILNQG